ncbi:MAG: 4-alpha-glucanotransferase, partial [Ginsengibacter sp.]
IQRFYNYMLGQYGDAPARCDGRINERIVLQHLYSPAMWSIFQLSDLLGIDEKIRREDPNEERINVPSEPHHHWNYRMHIYLEDLLEANEFNEELKKNMVASGRNP